jgi:hypothetical protein
MRPVRRGWFFRYLVPVLVLFAVHQRPVAGQVLIKAGDDVNFRLGFLLQGWGDWTQDPVSEGYSQSFLLRRVRFLATGNFGSDVSFFFMSDNPRLGSAGAAGARSLSAGFLVQDAFVEWKLAGDPLILDVGLFYVPLSRAALTGSSSNLSFDGATFCLLENSFTQSTAGRDVGVSLKGYLAGDRLEYRAAVFSGQRQGPAPAGEPAGSRNSPRFAARLQYDVFDPEKGYFYTGTNRGLRRILALGAWGDTQGDFRAGGADVFADIPVGRNAVTAEADYFYYDGGRQFTQVVGGVAVPLLPKEDALYAQAGYYFGAIALQPFLRYEQLRFREERFRNGDQRRYSGGANWYVAGQNLKVTPFYERVAPSAAPAGLPIKDTNHFGVQLQFFYF